MGHGGGAGHLSAFARHLLRQPPRGSGHAPGAVRELGQAGLRGGGGPDQFAPSRSRPPLLSPRPALSLCPGWGVGAVPEPRRPSSPHRRVSLAGAGLELAVRPRHGPCLASPRDRFVQILGVCGDGFPPRARVPVPAVPRELGLGPKLFASFFWALLCRLVTWNLRLFLRGGSAYWTMAHSRKPAPLKVLALAMHGSFIRVQDPGLLVV